MNFNAILGNIRGWVVKFALARLRAWVEKQAASGRLAVYIASLGTNLGQELGKIVPVDWARRFLAAFLSGFADGVESTAEGKGQGTKVVAEAVADPLAHLPGTSPGSTAQK